MERKKELPIFSGRIPAREEMISRIQEFTLFSDTFMSVALEDLEACQYVLRILTGNYALELKTVKSQYRITQVASHDAQLDVLAEDVSGMLYALEIQQRDTVDHPRRVRFYEAAIDSAFLLKGQGYDELPEVWLFYIGAKDFQGSRVTSWDVEKRHSETHERYQDGLRTTYVNAEVDDQTEIARLMRYFKTADPEDMSAGALSARVSYLKKEKRGQDRMCEVTEWFWKQGYESGEQAGLQKKAKETAVNLASMGMTVEQIAQAVKTGTDTVYAWING